MPLAGTEDALAAAIKAIILGDSQAVDNDSLDALCDGIAQAVIAHLLANTVVNSLGLVSPVGPVTGASTIS